MISGNAGTGVNLLLGGADTNTIQGNYIGINANATAGLGNQQQGILINVGPDGNTVTGNVIGFNTTGGIRIIGNGTDNTTNNVIRGNWIGTDSTGTLNFGNGLEGIAVQTGAAGNQIGGTGVGQGNVVAFNGTAGVAVYTSSTANPIRGNAVYSNGGLGIDLDNGFGTGVTPNDPGDGDSGSNGLQNFPVLLFAQSNAGLTTIAGTFNSTASSTFTLDFYSSPSGDEGAVYLGSASVTTDSSGDAVINVGLAASVAAGQVITATATSSSNDTSEFSAAITVVAGGMLVVDTTSDVTDGNTSSIAALYANKGADGFISLREAILAANATANANASTPDKIYFDILGSGVKTINVGSAMPDITAAVVIDGATQPGYAGTPLIELNGTSAGAGVDGLVLEAGSSGSTVRGLVINRFGGSGMEVNSNNNTLAGNYFGIDPTATVARANGWYGIYVSGASNTIGGTTAGRATPSRTTRWTA